MMKDDLEDTGVNGRIIINRIFERLDGGHRLDRSGSGQGQVAGSCEYGDEPSGSIKCGYFFLNSFGRVSLPGKALLHGVSFSLLKTELNPRVILLWVCVRQIVLLRFPPRTSILSCQLSFTNHLSS